MRTKKLLTVNKQEIVDIDITCNSCGKTELIDDNNYTLNKFHDIHMSFEYGSQYVGEYWKFDLCENCLTKLVESFKIKPEGFGDN